MKNIHINAEKIDTININMTSTPHFSKITIINQINYKKFIFNYTYSQTCYKLDRR